MAYNTIKLKKYSDVIEEYTAGGTILPGMLLAYSADDTVIAHNDDAPAATCLPIFALEDALQGRGIDDAYVSGDPVQCWIAGRGDQVYAILEDGAHVEIGEFLESNGAGYLQKFTSGNGAVAQALEHLDLSGSSGEEESVGPLGFNKRIKVRIV
jgi:hypothetical protein